MCVLITSQTYITSLPRATIHTAMTTTNVILLLLAAVSSVSSFDEEDAEKVREFVNGINECREIPGRFF